MARGLSRFPGRNVRLRTEEESRRRSVWPQAAVQQGYGEIRDGSAGWWSGGHGRRPNPYHAQTRRLRIEV